MSHEQEGVIRFSYRMADRLAVEESCLGALGAWRTILRRLGLLGQDPGRYDGYGFGNVSHRLGSATSFVISGSQTGHLAALGPAEWVRVLGYDLERHSLVAAGLAAPSSESLTHAALYDLDPAIGCVLHVHSPEIFEVAGVLDLPATAADVPYGTPAMAREIARVWRSDGQGGLAVMAGHLDGVLAWGKDPAEAGLPLLRALAAALALKSR